MVAEQRERSRWRSTLVVMPMRLADEWDAAGEKKQRTSFLAKKYTE